ncbi:unnamed protein product [Symbiodinium sp. CCMP2592]|nr:unnamed protein product [Symbiodinium sp. CCMP2592]
MKVGGGVQVVPEPAVERVQAPVDVLPSLQVEMPMASKRTRLSAVHSADILSEDADEEVLQCVAGELGEAVDGHVRAQRSPSSMPWGEVQSSYCADAAHKCSSIEQVRAATECDLLARAVELLCFEVSRSGDDEICCVADRFTASVSGLLHFPIGLAPVGWVGYWRKVFLNFAKLLSATMCAMAVYRVLMTTGFEQWSHTLHAMEAFSFLALLMTVSSSDGFRELMTERLPEVQERLDSAMRASLKWDLLPVSACFCVWLVCFIVRIRLCILEGSEIFAHAFPLSSAVQRTAWAFALLRLSRSMIVLMERFALSYSHNRDDFDLAYEQWACISAFTSQISHWTGVAHLHISTFALLGMFPPFAEIFLGRTYDKSWLLSHLFASMANCCLTAYVLQRAAAVNQQKESAAMSVGSFQWALSWSAKWRQHLLLKYMSQSAVGIYMCGVCLTNPILAKLASVLVTGASVLLARLVSLPEEKKDELAEQWEHFLEALKV